MTITTTNHSTIPGHFIQIEYELGFTLQTTAFSKTSEHLFFVCIYVCVCFLPGFLSSSPQRRSYRQGFLKVMRTYMFLSLYVFLSFFPSHPLSLYKTQQTEALSNSLFFLHLFEPPFSIKLHSEARLKEINFQCLSVTLNLSVSSFSL